MKKPFRIASPRRFGSDGLRIVRTLLLLGEKTPGDPTLKDKEETQNSCDRLPSLFHKKDKTDTTSCPGLKRRFLTNHQRKKRKTSPPAEKEDREKRNLLFGATIRKSGGRNKI